ncbi:MAG: endonuclease MutS2 [Leadbetterella sp.]
MDTLPSNIEEKLGFESIRERLKSLCLSPQGVARIDKLKPSSRFDFCKRVLQQTAEFKSILEFKEDFPSQNYSDLGHYLQKLKLEGYFLDVEEFSDLRGTLYTVQRIFDFFSKCTETEFPQLFALYYKALPQQTAGNSWIKVIYAIDSVIDESAKVRDTASAELGQIRRKLASEQREVQKDLERIYKTAKNSGWIGDDMSLTIRNGRLVIPLQAEYKRRLGGYVHDESATGQIAFVEPSEVLEANNRIRDLELAERKEIIRILMGLTQEVRIYGEDMAISNEFLGVIDFNRAKAKLAISWGAVLPNIHPKPILDWHAAEHPLLKEALHKNNKKVVPLNIQLSDKKRILVVSGPNAGGKSVLLKTVGLLQYMHQCGLLVSMSPDSEVGMFESIFIGLGDEQSIENDLSTYSSHLSNMRDFVQKSNKNTLFLIDEFGSGTEPTLGGALAEAVLEKLLESHAYGVINTHYTNLKVFADKREGIINGSMKYDAKQLKPMFELSMGQPGSSFAFEVAENIGLPQEIIKQAKMNIGAAQLNFENLLVELEKERKYYADQNESLKREGLELRERMNQYQVLKEFLEEEKKKILNQAKNQAKALLTETNKKIENTVKEIRETQAEKERVKSLKLDINEFEQKNLKPEKERPIISLEKDDSKIQIGDNVRIQGQENIGQVLKLIGNEAEVSFGIMTSKVKLVRLEKLSKKATKQAQKEHVRSLGGVDFNEKMAQFTYNLDIRGKRADEALIVLNSMLDDAIMLGYTQIRILHGKGDGILRNIVRNHLKSYAQVKKISDEHPDRGGQGVSIVDMN